MPNVLPATVMRQVFLGSSRDYFMRLGDGTELRVTAPPDRSVASGAEVWLHLPPEDCRALMQ
jgi:iron(III) transport system ATP-binding protein